MTVDVSDQDKFANYKFCHWYGFLANWTEWKRGRQGWVTGIFVADPDCFANPVSIAKKTEMRKKGVSAMVYDKIVLVLQSGIKVWTKQRVCVLNDSNRGHGMRPGS